MDITSITTILTSAIDIARHIKSSDNSLEKAERDLQLAELISALADAKMEITNIQQQLLEKDQQLHELNEQIAVREKLRYEQPYYWLVEDDNKDGPFCQVCYDKERKPIRLHEGEMDNRGLWECKVSRISTLTAIIEYLETPTADRIGEQPELFHILPQTLEEAVFSYWLPKVIINHIH